MSEPLPALSRGARRAAGASIGIYQRFLSPLLGARCRYYPSCSEYGRLSIERFGILRGIVLASWRLLRCNPLSRGGFDYPEDQRLFSVPSRAAQP